MNRLRDALAAIGEDTSVHVVVLAAEGPTFSSGHDLKEVRGADHARQQEIFDVWMELMLTIQRIPQPVIARVPGWRPLRVRSWRRRAIWWSRRSPPLSPRRA